jgi:hypothetical protein
MNPADILNCLADQSAGVYPAAAVEAAIAQRQEVVPLLLEVLRDFHRDPVSYADRAADLRATYACLLLGYFREPRAHEPLLAVFSLPEEHLKYFGDMITEDLACLLHRTSQGGAGGLMALARPETPSPWCRGAALAALVLKVADGSLPRAQMVSFLRELLANSPDDTGIWSQVADAACDLHPGELLPVLRDGYEHGLIDPGWVSLDDLEDAADASPEELLAGRLSHDAERYPADFHRWVSWWACYQPSSRSRRSGAQAHGWPREHASDHARRKQRRKAQRQARRRNRRRR